jgi:hypothetical protein
MVRLRGIPDEKFNTVGSTFRGLQASGYNNICKWILRYTGTSSGAQTEIEAPTAAWDGALEEVTTVLFTKTKINTVGDEYLKVPFSTAAGGSADTEHYFYVDKQETTTVTCLAKADCVAESSFHFWVDNGAGCEVEYYCWMNVAGTDSDPSEDGTAIECDISGATTAIEVAEVIDNLIDAKTGVGCDNGGTANLPIINANNGNVTDISDGDLATGFTWTIEQGGDDPNRAACCTITCKAQADCVESSSFHFFVADGSGSETEYYIWINKGAGSDPAESGTAIECDISLSGTAIEVAEVIDGLIAAKDDVGCDNGGGATLPIINAQSGSVTDPYDGTTTATTFSFIFQDGRLTSGASGTGHSCDISAATTAADVGTIFVAAFDAVAGISSTGTSTALIESDNTGSITDVSQSGSSLGTITVVRQGAASYGGGYLYVQSSSASDDSGAADHCQQVILEGFDAITGLYATDTIALSGTTAVKTAVQFKRISHLHGSKYGTGDADAAGNITVETSATANQTALLTIAAGATESGGCRIHVPDGQYLLVEDAIIYNVTNAATGATYVTVHLTGFEDSSNITPDYDHFTVVVQDITHQASDAKISREILTGSDTAVIICKESEVGTVGNEDFVFALELYTFTD